MTVFISLNVPEVSCVLHLFYRLSTAPEIYSESMRGANMGPRCHVFVIESPTLTQNLYILYIWTDTTMNHTFLQWARREKSFRREYQQYSNSFMAKACSAVVLAHMFPRGSTLSLSLTCHMCQLAVVRCW